MPTRAISLVSPLSSLLSLNAASRCTLASSRASAPSSSSGSPSRAYSALASSSSKPLRIIETSLSASGSGRRWERRRTFMAPPPVTSAGPSDVGARFAASDLPMEEYHRVSDEALDALLDTLEEVFYADATSANAQGWEVEYHSGVMTINFGERHGTYVLNKQPPNKQIWLSSPISGPKRYDYDASHGTWFYSRDHVSLGELLKEEFERITEKEIDIPLR